MCLQGGRFEIFGERLYFRTKGKSEMNSPFEPGDIVCVESDKGFRILKMLVVEAEGVYFRIFAQQFKERPGIVDVSELTLPVFGPINYALTHDHFTACNPHVIAYQPVIEEELKDYRMWRSEKGSYQ